MAQESEFTVAFDDIAPHLLPEGARAVGSPAFLDAVRDLVAREYEQHGGWVRIAVDAQARLLRVTWGAGDRLPTAVESAVAKLQRGEYADAVRTLELARLREPDNPVVLYNLGMALSDMGALPPATTHLRRVAALDPGNANVRVALGVALARQGDTPAAIASFRDAVKCDPTNPWAHRNLGGGLLREGKPADAEPHFRRTIELNPSDPAAHAGLGRALLALDRPEEADGSFLRAIELDPHGSVGESARDGRSRIAQAVFRARAGGHERPDAVMYLLGALERFAGAPPRDVQAVGLEVALLGRGGIDTNDPDQKYSLKSMPGKFSGLHLMCLMYAAFQVIAPTQDIGFDVAEEYRTALSLFEARKGKGG